MAATERNTLGIDVIDQDAIVPAVSDIEALVHRVIGDGERDVHAASGTLRACVVEIRLADDPASLPFEQAVLAVELEAENAVVVLVRDP